MFNNNRQVIELEYKIKDQDKLIEKLSKEILTINSKYDIIIGELEKLKQVPEPKVLSTADRIKLEVAAIQENKLIEAALDEAEFRGVPSEDLSILSGSI